MILYVNGDSHSAGGEAVSPATFLCDDDKYLRLGIEDPILQLVWGDEARWAPYPTNLEKSYGQVLANTFHAVLHCHARSAGSNFRIIRTTKEYLQNNKPNLIIIGWSTWEREEWYNEDDNVWYQVGASGHDSVPKKWSDRYKQFVINANWSEKTKFWHEEIWNFHQYLNTLSIPHLFFNCDHTFFSLTADSNFETYDWGLNYIEPYSPIFSYSKYLSAEGHKHTKWNHFFADGHAKWAEFLLPHLTRLL